MQYLATPEQIKIEFMAHLLLLCSHGGLGASSGGPTALALLWGPEEGRCQGGGGGGTELSGMGQTPDDFTVPWTCNLLLWFVLKDPEKSWPSIGTCVKHSTGSWNQHCKIAQERA